MKRVITINSNNLEKSIETKEILTKNSEDDVYKVIDIEGDGYKGHMLVVYDPSRIDLVQAPNLKYGGKQLAKLLELNDGIAGINASGFNYSKETGYIPNGIVIMDNEIVWGADKEPAKTGGIIATGFEAKEMVGRTPKEIDASWGSQRVKGISIRRIIIDYYKRLFHIKDKKKDRVDTASDKRVELHLHTKMSNMDSVVGIKQAFAQAKAFTKLARLLKAQGYEVASYSGYTFEELLEGTPEQQELLRHIDVLIDGPFLLSERSLELNFRGSRNQRILNIPKSLERLSPVLEKSPRWLGEY